MNGKKLNKKLKNKQKHNWENTIKQIQIKGNQTSKW